MTIIKITDKCARHTNIDFPGHKHATLYDVNKIEGAVREHLKALGINIHLEKRVNDVDVDKNKIRGILLSDDTYVTGDVFIETTGSTGPMGNCLRYGNGCSMCVLRCPAFGPRISISARCGVADIQGERNDDELGAFSGSCKLAKESLSDEIREELDSLIAEAEEVIRVEHDHKACVEKPIDRKQAKIAKIDYNKVADTVLNYSAQNIPENEETTLDKLADKLGV